MSLSKEQKVLAQDFIILKQQVKAELQRRSYNTDISSYGSSSYDYSNVPTVDNRIDVEHVNKLLIPLAQIRSGDFTLAVSTNMTSASVSVNETTFKNRLGTSDNVVCTFTFNGSNWQYQSSNVTLSDWGISFTGATATNGSKIVVGYYSKMYDIPANGKQTGDIIKDLSSVSNLVSVYQQNSVQSKTNNCAGSCSGLCSTSCTTTCATGCAGSCTGSCSSCTGCSGSCSGTCSGCTGTCSGTCSGCTSCTGCSGTCTGTCTGCKGTCLTTCTACSGGCTGCTSCTGGCSGCTSCTGCSGSCSGTCKSGCSSTCSGTCKGKQRSTG